MIEPEQEEALWKAVTDMARSYARARVDLQIMSGMLLRAELDGVPPQDWRADLERLRELPAHKAALAEIESLIEELRRARRQNELRQLLSGLTKTDPID